MLFFEQVLDGRFQVVVSAITSREVAYAPEKVRELYESFTDLAEIIETSAEALQLRDAFVHAGFVRRKSLNDALHVALATVSGCDMIVSWIFRDIVNYRKIPLYNAVSLVNGYRPVSIHSPLEVTQDEDE